MPIFGCRYFGWGFGVVGFWDWDGKLCAERKRSKRGFEGVSIERFSKTYTFLNYVELKNLRVR